VVRIAALFCGVTAGLLTLLAPTVGIDLLTPFLKLWGISAGLQMLGTIAWHVPAGAAVLGGLLAFVVPSLGALLLGIAGAAWLGLGVVDPSFFRPELLVPAVLSSAGALMAFLTEELEFRSRRAARRGRGEMVPNGGDSQEQLSLPDRDDLPRWPERPMRPIRSEPDEKQATAREEAKAHDEAKARVEAFVSSYTDFVKVLDKAAVAVPSEMRGDGLPPSLDFIGEAGSDGYLASIAAAVEGHPAADPVRAAGRIEIAVVGAHLSGLPLNPELVEFGGTFIRAAATTPHYALYALPNTTPPKPGLLRRGSTAIAMEVWSLDAAGLGEFVSRIPSPLCIGTLSLDDGTSVKGILVEPAAVQDEEDISHFGRWRVPGAVTRLHPSAHGLERKIAHRIPDIEADVGFDESRPERPQPILHRLERRRIREHNTDTEPAQPGLAGWPLPGLAGWPLPGVDTVPDVEGEPLRCVVEPQVAPAEAAHDEQATQADTVAVEGHGPVEVVHVQADVADMGSGRHARLEHAGRQARLERGRRAKFDEQVVEVDGLAVGLGAAMLEGDIEALVGLANAAAPGGLEGDLDAVIVGIPQVDSLGDEVVGGGDADPALQRADHHLRQVGAGRDVDGDVVEAETVVEHLWR